MNQYSFSIHVAVAFRGMLFSMAMVVCAIVVPLLAEAQIADPPTELQVSALTSTADFAEDGIIADLTGFDVIIPTCGLAAGLRLNGAPSGVSLRRWAPDGGPPDLSSYWVVVYEPGGVIVDEIRATVELWELGQWWPSDTAPLTLYRDDIDNRCWVSYPGRPPGWDRPCLRPWSL